MFRIRLCRLQFKWRGNFQDKEQCIDILSKKSEKELFGTIYFSLSRVRYKENIKRKKKQKIQGSDTQYHTERNHLFVSF